MPKALTQSSQFYFGVAQIIFAIVGQHFAFLDIQTAMALVLSGFGTIGFRLNTTQPIGSIFPKAPTQ